MPNPDDPNEVDKYVRYFAALCLLVIGLGGIGLASVTVQAEGFRDFIGAGTCLIASAIAFTTLFRGR